jgi:hypothetical protein
MPRYFFFIELSLADGHFTPIFRHIAPLRRRRHYADISHYLIIYATTE